MAFLPEFETDIFISHARVDNKTADLSDGWVTVFLRHLEIELSQAFAGRMNVVELWWDKELEGNRFFDEAIRHTISNSAIFLALNSVGFANSEYCQKEVRWFSENAALQGRSLKVGDASRIFNVLLYNLQPHEWPEEFKGRIGSPFHDAGESKEKGRPISFNSEEFRQRIRKLSDEIAATLNAIKQSAIPAPSEKPETIKKDIVFLAYTHDDLKERRALVENELIRNGVTVIPRMPPPYPAAQHEAKVIEQLKRANLSVHLFNDRRGQPIDEDESNNYPQRQIQLALKHAPAQLIWVPQSLDIKSISDETQRKLLDGLANGERETSGYRFVSEPVSVITDQILDRLKQLKPPPPPKPEEVATLLHTHPKDYSHVSWLNQFLQKFHEPVIISPRVEDPKLSLADLEERLRKAARLIIVFNEAAEDWVRERLIHAIHFALNEKCPLNRCAVFFAPPRNKADQKLFNFGPVPVDYFDMDDFLSPNGLTKFFGRGNGAKQ